MKERPAGTFSSALSNRSVLPLTPGKSYQVVRSFVDADGDRHVSGEQWTLIAVWFNKFDNEVTLGVKANGSKEWSVPLLWSPEHQEEIISNISSYVQALH